jgi:hypothetical protein
MRRYTVISLLAAGIFGAIGTKQFAGAHPRSGALWATLAVVSLIGAWLSIKAGRQKAETNNPTLTHR